MSDNTGVSTEDTPPERPLHVTTSDGPTAESLDTDKVEGDQTPDSSAKSDDQSTDGDETTSKRKRGNSAKRKINRLNKQISELQDQAGQVPTLTAKLESLESEMELLKQTSHGATKPKREDYPDDEAYAEGYAEWKGASKKPVKNDPPPAAKPAQQPSQDDPHQDQREDIMDFGAEEYGDDWEEAMEPRDGAPINQHMAEYLFDLDDAELSAQVIMELHDNRKEAKEMYLETMNSSRKTVKSMDALVAKVKADKPAKAKKSKEKGRKEPPAPASHEKTGIQDDVSADISGNETMDDYAAKRMKQEKSKRRN